MPWKPPPHPRAQGPLPAHRIRWRRRRIAISAYGTDSDQSLEAACEVHLMKPADPRFIESLLG